MLLSLPAALADDSATQQDLYSLNFHHLDGSQASFEQYRGKVLLVNFWASWCAPCVSEMPALNSLARRFGDEPVAVVAVNAGESADTIRRFRQRLDTPLALQLLLDSEGRTFSDFGIAGLPTTYLFDRQGKLVDKVIGAKAWDSQEWQNRLRALIANTP